LFIGNRQAPVIYGVIYQNFPGACRSFFIQPAKVVKVRKKKTALKIKKFRILLFNY